MAVDDLSRTFSALADPTRRALLRRLSRGPATVNELRGPFDISGPAVSKHLRVLEDAGLVVTSRQGQTRPRTLAPNALDPISDWTESMRRAWEVRHDALATYLAELQDTSTPEGNAK